MWGSSCDNVGCQSGSSVMLVRLIVWFRGSRETVGTVEFFAFMPNSRSGGRLGVDLAGHCRTSPWWLETTPHEHVVSAGPLKGGWRYTAISNVGGKATWSISWHSFSLPQGIVNGTAPYPFFFCQENDFFSDYGSSDRWLYRQQRVNRGYQCTSQSRSRQHFEACPMLWSVFHSPLQLWHNFLGFAKPWARPWRLEWGSVALPITLMIGPDMGSSITSPDRTNSYSAASQLPLLGLPSLSSQAYLTLTGIGVGGSTGYCHHLGWCWVAKERWLALNPWSILARLFCMVVVVDVRKRRAALWLAVSNWKHRHIWYVLRLYHPHWNGVVSWLRIQLESRTRDCDRHVIGRIWNCVNRWKAIAQLDWSERCRLTYYTQP